MAAAPGARYCSLFTAGTLSNVPDIMADIVRIQLDLASGTVSIEAPPESLDSVFEKLESFLPQLADAYADFAPLDADDGDDGEEGSGAAETSSATPNPKAKRGTRRDSSKETYRSVDLGLNESQRNAFRQFYADKTPKGQNDQVLTIMYWLQREAGTASLDRDQIFTGFRTVDAQVPGRIGSVLSNLRIAGMIVPQDDGKYVLHHVGEDYVKFKLPKKKTA